MGQYKLPIQCKCGKEIKDVYHPSDNFEYIGADEQNNPIFKCKVCEEVIYG